LLVKNNGLTDTDEKLAALLPKLLAAPWLALDTEADSLHAYPEKVCLIQISTDGGDELVDPLAPKSILIRCSTRSMVARTDFSRGGLRSAAAAETPSIRAEPRFSTPCSPRGCWVNCNSA
jgi:hypothetical protein